MRYVGTDFADEGGEDKVVDALNELDETRGTKGNRLYYLAIPPAAFSTVVEAIGKRRSADGLDAARRREAVRPRPRVGAAR